MAAVFGHTVQDFYLEMVRRNQAERKARLAALKTAEDARKLVAETRAKVRACFRFPAGKTPLEPRITGTLENPGFTLEKVLFRSRENYTVSANFLLPRNRSGKVPALLFLCGHSAAGKGDAEYQTAMRGLAQRGFAVLAVDPVGQGERHQFRDVPGFTPESPCVEHNILGKQMLLTGEWFGAWRTYDAVRAMDYLLTRPEIDPARVGVLGNSGGGTLTSWVSAVDDRFFAAAPGCFVTTWEHNVENELPADIEQCPPHALERGLEIADFLIAAAPRPFLLEGQKNDFFDPRGILEVRDELRALYRLLGCEDRIELAIGPDDHGFSLALREAAYGFFCRRAEVGNPSEAEGAIEVPPPEETFAAPGGEVTALPGERRTHDLIVERASALRSARRKLPLTEMRRILTEKMGMEPPFAPRFRVLRRIMIPGTRTFSARFGLETEPGRVMCVLHSFVRGLIHLPESERILLYIPHLDSLAEVGEREEPEADLYALDLRGVGECTPTGCDMPPDNGFFACYGFDFHYTALANMFGKSYLGGKVKDILCAVELFSGICGDIELEGHGVGGIPALIAAVLSDRIRRIRLTDVPDSWESMIVPAVPAAEKSPMSCMIPGILEDLDLPDLREAIAEKLRP